MVQQISLDAQLENVNSSFADFTQFPESVVQVRHILICKFYKSARAVLIFVAFNEAQAICVTIRRDLARETDKIATCGRTKMSLNADFPLRFD